MIQSFGRFAVLLLENVHRRKAVSRPIDQKNRIEQLEQIIKKTHNGLDGMMSQMLNLDDEVYNADATVSAYGGSLENVDKGVKDAADSTMVNTKTIGNTKKAIQPLRI